jgi:RNA polymerase II subunit A small phosphatase-like protein
MIKVPRGLSFSAFKFICELSAGSYPCKIPASVVLHAMATISAPTKQVLNDLEQTVNLSGKGDDMTMQGTEEGLEGGKGDETPKAAAAASPGTPNGSAEQLNTGAEHGPVPSTKPQQVTVPDETPQKNVQEDDTEKDKGSLSTTLTATMKDTQTRRKSNKLPTQANGEKPKVSLATPSKPKSTDTRSKSSFISKLMRLLVPCISASPAHAIDMDDRASSSTDPNSSLAHKEKLGLKDAERPAKTELKAGSSSSPDALVIPPPLSADAEVILPPTPTKRLLPQAETEGVTSGAVQPPGSTGDDTTHDHSRTHTRDSGDESEGTSYTEDDDVDDHLDDAEDDEDRLILNGGAGIPIGPVSP